MDTKIFLLKEQNRCLREGPHAKDMLTFQQDKTDLLPVDLHLFHQKPHHKGFKDMKIYQRKMQVAYGQEIFLKRTLEWMVHGWCSIILSSVDLLFS